MSRGANGRLLALLAVAALVAGCIVEKPGPETASATTAIPITLTAEQPVAVRAIRFQAEVGPQRVRAIELSLSTDLPDRAQFRNDIWVSFVDPTSGGLVAGRTWAHAGIGGPNGPGDCPLPGCDETWVAIIRWLSPVPETTLEASLSARIDARAANDPRPSEPPFALARQEVGEVAVQEPRPEPAAMATFPGSTRIDLATGQVPAARHLVVRVAADVVEQQRRYPNVGRLAFFAADSDRSSDRIGMRSTVFVNGLGGTSPSGLGGLTGATEIDLLSLCATQGPCEIPVDISWTVVGRTNQDTVPPSGFATADWQLLATFLTPRGSLVDPGAITIVEAAPS
jgi:hypothetical protein